LSCLPHLEDSALPPLKGLVTVSLNLDFLGSARIGQWLEFRADLTRTGRSLSFAGATVLADGQPCARATGVFKAQR
ncbi:MAG TPA: thioesterase, partial [Alcanivorax sp.]|nr:thioesterase [Alcanivorax sp.]